jgi:hypothetical protein
MGYWEGDIFPHTSKVTFGREASCDQDIEQLFKKRCIRTGDEGKQDEEVLCETRLGKQN